MLSRYELRQLLEKHHLRLSKRLGQNHLVDRDVIADLIRRCGFCKTDCVFEIGAGLGALTESLAEQVREVIAVEIDRGICPILHERMRPFHNVTVLEADVLERLPLLTQEVIVVGAIPYSITADILVALAQNRKSIRESWLVMQQEVAERLTAGAGSAHYGRLSLMAQYHWNVRVVAEVPPEAFYPEPRVSSRLVHLAPKLPPPMLLSEATFFAVVKASFAYRRKKLVYGLSHGPNGVVGKAQAQTILDSLGWDPSIRVEAVAFDDFVTLSNAVFERSK